MPWVGVIYSAKISQYLHLALTPIASIDTQHALIQAHMSLMRIEPWWGWSQHPAFTSPTSYRWCFYRYWKENGIGIGRQFIAAHTPHQKGIAKSKKNKLVRWHEACWKIKVLLILFRQKQFIQLWRRRTPQVSHVRVYK